MTQKSHVGMLHAVCPICGNKDEAQSAILLDRRLQNTLEQDNYAMAEQPCGDCSGKLADGYVAMVEVDESKSTIRKGDKTQQSDVHRTGFIAWMRSEAFSKNFNVPLPPKGMAFIPIEVGDMFRKAAPQEEE